MARKAETMVLTIDIERIKEILKDALMREWRAQGHFMDGAAVESIEYVVEKTLSGLNIKGYVMPYAGYLDTGVPAERIPYYPGSGRKTSKYISGLMRYAQRRMNISDMKEAKSVAFAIARTHKREGLPSKGSMRFSRTGRRTHWIEDALRKNESILGEAVRHTVKQFIEISLDDLLTKYKQVI